MKSLRMAREAGWFEVARGGALVRVSAALAEQFEHFIAEQAVHFGRIANDIGQAPASLQRPDLLLQAASGG